VSERGRDSLHGVLDRQWNGKAWDRVGVPSRIKGVSSFAIDAKFVGFTSTSLAGYVMCVGA
jgi:hypothetical protein